MAMTATVTARLGANQSTIKINDAFRDKKLLRILSQNVNNHQGIGWAFDLVLIYIICLLRILLTLVSDPI